MAFVFHQLVPHWSPISCSLPSPGRLAPSRAEVFVGFRCGRLVQALPSSPPSAGLGPCPSASAFFFSLAFSGFARSGLGVLVCVCSFPLLLRSPLRVLVKLSNVHLIFTLISFFHPPFILIFISFLRAPPCRRQGVCVYHLNRRKTSSLYYMILYFNLWQGAEGSPVVASATEAPHWMIR